MSFDINNRRYAGSKYKLNSWIKEIINKNCNEKEIFADIFSGTGIVAATNLYQFNHIIINDLLFSNEVIYNAFFSKKKWNKNIINEFFLENRALKANNINDNYFSLNFGDKFFINDDAKIIGKIRKNIEKIKYQIEYKEYCILLSSLLYSADKTANTVGHYDAYIRNKKINKKFIFELIKPINHNKKIKIYREDANVLVKKIKADVFYVDPPYNSRQYSRFYHLLENLTKWERPELFGVAMKPEPENMSDYCRNSAYDKFSDLINDIDSKHIIVSYNNTYKSKSSSSENKITLEQIKDVLNVKGELREYSRAYNHFNAGKTSFDDHKEYIFYTKVK